MPSRRHDRCGRRWVLALFARFITPSSIVTCRVLLECQIRCSFRLTFVITASRRGRLDSLVRALRERERERRIACDECADRQSCNEDRPGTSLDRHRRSRDDMGSCRCGCAYVSSLLCQQTGSRALEPDDVGPWWLDDRRCLKDLVVTII